MFIWIRSQSLIYQLMLTEIVVSYNWIERISLYNVCETHSQSINKASKNNISHPSKDNLKRLETDRQTKKLII